MTYKEIRIITYNFVKTEEEIFKTLPELEKNQICYGYTFRLHYIIFYIIELT